MNLRWSWHPPLRDLFESIDPARWATVGGDPVAMLSAVISSRPVCAALTKRSASSDMARLAASVVGPSSGAT